MILEEMNDIVGARLKLSVVTVTVTPNCFTHKLVNYVRRWTSGNPGLRGSVFAVEKFSN
jgi:hypothetical protein